MARQAGHKSDYFGLCADFNAVQIAVLCAAVQRLSVVDTCLCGAARTEADYQQHAVLQAMAMGSGAGVRVAGELDDISSYLVDNNSGQVLRAAGASTGQAVAV
jgi:hypothetical protein